MNKVNERRPGQGNDARNGHEPVAEILARHIPDLTVGLVGCLCVTLPIAYKVAGTAYWPFVVAYGGCLVGIALSGVFEK